MQLTIGKGQAEVSKDGKSIDFAPPPGTERAWEIPGLGGKPASSISTPEESVAKTSSSSLVAPTGRGGGSTGKAVDFAGSLGPGLLFAAVALGFVFHRFAKAGERMSLSGTGNADQAKSYDQASDRHAFMKRYGGDT